MSGRDGDCLRGPADAGPGASSGPDHEAGGAGIPQVLDGIGALDAAVGRHLGWSGWHQVTQEQVDTFAQVTGDHQWIHVDPARAAVGPFGGTIAHGYLTLSLIPRLVWQVYAVDGVRMSVNYGSDRVRYPAPLPVGSRVRAGVEIVGVVSSDDARRVTTRVTIEREGGDRPVCVADVLSVVYP